ncbi:GNAT family N-acetyltransferase [Polyangium sp. 15x6]|uniref:GNAT family N-acetyltransferase n=1 Tax=Polyangium sp. 15x6 TaxID=3042687 RepID=UPI00249B774E|nr:GNAT family N-acetyltransferase [Polyangium sp. 15x6]MDI3288897.1 GNAT family N-acetyltransferase [Polyangium sp. 15x6]
MSCPKLITERLELVPMTVEVVEAVFDGRRADTEALLGAKMPNAWPGRALVERAFLARLDAVRADPEHRLWGDRVALSLEPSPRVIGSVVFHGGPDEDGIVEVAYGIEEESQRQGFGFEAVSASVAWALAEPRVRAVRASTFTWHFASCRILEKLGFRIVDREDDLLGEMLKYEVGPSAFRR